MNTTMAILILPLMLILGTDVTAQDKSALSQRVLDSVATNEMGWKLNENRVMDTMGVVQVDVVFADWRRGKAQMSVLILIYAAPDGAKEYFPKAFRGCIDCKEDQTPLSTKVPNLGDENRIWEDRNHHVTGVVFRKGKILVSAEASS